MITILVEGSGDKRALPVLMQRARPGIRVHCIDMKGKSNIVRRDHGFENTIRRQHAQGRNHFWVLLDGDVTAAPYRSLHEEQMDMPRRASILAQELTVAIQVYWAVLCMESWLIGGLHAGATYCGLSRINRIPNNTETGPQNPKQWLEGCLRSREYDTATQECLAGRIDMQQAIQRNLSLRHFINNLPVVSDSTAS